MTISLLNFAFTAFYGKHWKGRLSTQMLNFIVGGKNIQILYNSGAGGGGGGGWWWPILHVPCLFHDHSHFPVSVGTLFIIIRLVILRLIEGMTV